MARCDICGKGSQFGHNVSHSHRKTARSWEPNIKKTTILVNGKPQRVNICMRCLRTRARLSA